MIARLYEDDEIVVVDKPSGLPSQPGEGVRISLVEAFERDFRTKAYPVHRLDRETAGCVLIAKSAAAARRWTGLIATKDVARTYRAVCGGIPQSPKGRIEDPVDIRGERKSASTMYSLVMRLECSFEDNGKDTFSLLELILGTGRSHQIRIHLAGIGLPILGDDRHGDFSLNRSARRKYGVRRLMLWARSLRLPSGVVVHSTVPDHFSVFLSRFPEARDLGDS